MIQNLPFTAVCCALLAVAGAASAADNLRAEVRFRRPSAAAAFDEGRMLAVANRDSGSISVVETRAWEVVGEYDVGRRLSDIAAAAGRTRLLAVDEARHEVIVLTADGAELSVARRLPVPRHPVSVVVGAHGTWGSVASLWSRRVTLLDGLGADTLSARTEIELPFAPRAQAVLADDRTLVVAGAFRAQLALIDVTQGRLIAVREFPGHNIGGLTVSPDGRQLYITHQLLESDAPTTYDSIHWGGLMRNLLRVVPVDVLRDPARDLLAEGEAILFGSTGAGAADPAGITFVDDSRLAAVAAGSDRAAVFHPVDNVVAPVIETGRRPARIVPLPGQSRAAIVNTLSDSLTVIDTERGTSLCEVSLGPTPPAGPRERGESLFYDARLSHDGWLSCHSCHTDGHANGLLADTASDGSFGTPKRILSLLGTRDSNPWGWNGSLRTLHEQVVQSVASSMQGERLPLKQANDLVVFLHSLSPAPPLLPQARSDADADLLDRGRAVFHAAGCAACHVPSVTYTSDQIVDVGLEDEAGLRKFNPPSLRGVSQRDRWLHDGRALTLEEVLEDYAHPPGGAVRAQDLPALLRFLESL